MKDSLRGRKLDHEYCISRMDILRSVVNKEDILGKEFITNRCGVCVVVSYENRHNVYVTFKEHPYTTKCSLGNLKKGEVSNPLHPLTYGKGFKGVGKYSFKDKKVSSLWFGMMNRSFNLNFKEKYPTYRDVVVCEEWLCFQNFAEWCYSQKFFNVTDFNGEPYELDKDILVRGNKTYSPETCCFVPKAINNLFKFSNRQNKKNPLGVYFKKSLNKYGASYKDSEGKPRHIGYFNNQIDAFSAYKVVKESTIKDVAVKYKDFIDQRTYEAMVGWEVTLKD